MQKASKPSNLLFILPDQLGADRLGCYGADIRTPRIDALASESVTFDRAYTSSPICTPYRAILLSGKYPSETGVDRNGMALPTEGFVPLAEVLNSSGFTTSYAGKWHLSGSPQENRWVPPENRGGFKDFIGWESHHVDHWKGLIYENDPEPITMQGHETDALTDIACDRLRALSSGDTPFALFVGYQAPHPPCTPPKEYARLYENIDGRFKPNVPDSPPGYNKPGWDAIYPQPEFARRYAGEVSHLDACMGRLLDTLDDTGVSDDTAVVFTSDHGELAGSHGLFGKEVMLEESIHVPLLVRLPGRKPERTERLFATTDFYPTLLSLVGAGSGSAHRGVDQSQFLTEGDGTKREMVFSEYCTRCIFDGRYKLVTTMEMDEVLEIYDLESDEYEINNRKDDDSFIQVIEQLLAALKNEFGMA
jgi:arylsulfatase A-like enzyme